MSGTYPYPVELTVYCAVAALLEQRLHAVTEVVEVEVQVAAAVVDKMKTGYKAPLAGQRDGLVRLRWPCIDHALFGYL